MVQSRTIANTVSTFEFHKRIGITWPASYRSSLSQWWVRRLLSSGIYHLVVRWKTTYVSEEHFASIFRVKEQAKQEIRMMQVESRSSWWCLAWIIFRPWKWRLQFRVKRRLTFSELDGITSHEIEFFSILSLHRFSVLLHSDGKLQGGANKLI
jgi:hypothetical protein